MHELTSAEARLHYADAQRYLSERRPVAARVALRRAEKAERNHRDAMNGATS
jgi:hypothetical protein